MKALGKLLKVRWLQNRVWVEDAVGLQSQGKLSFLGYGPLTVLDAQAYSLKLRPLSAEPLRRLRPNSLRHLAVCEAHFPAGLGRGVLRCPPCPHNSQGTLGVPRRRRPCQGPPAAGDESPGLLAQPHTPQRPQPPRRTRPHCQGCPFQLNSNARSPCSNALDCQTCQLNLKLASGSKLGFTAKWEAAVYQGKDI